MIFGISIPKYVWCRQCYHLLVEMSCSILKYKSTAKYFKLGFHPFKGDPLHYSLPTYGIFMVSFTLGQKKKITQKHHGVALAVNKHLFFCKCGQSHKLRCDMDSGWPMGLFRERKVLMISTQALGWSSSVSSDLQTHSSSGSQLLCANNSPSSIHIQLLEPKHVLLSFGR